jgi:hypothetical protein
MGSRLVEFGIPRYARDDSGEGPAGEEGGRRKEEGGRRQEEGGIDFPASDHRG